MTTMVKQVTRPEIDLNFTDNKVAKIQVARRIIGKQVTKLEMARHIGRTTGAITHREKQIISLFGELSIHSINQYDLLQTELSNLLHYASYTKKMTNLQIGRIIYPNAKHKGESARNLIKNICFKVLDPYTFYNQQVIERLLKLKAYLIFEAKTKIKSYERKIAEQEKILLDIGYKS